MEFSHPDGLDGLWPAEVRICERIGKVRHLPVEKELKVPASVTEDTPVGMAV